MDPVAKDKLLENIQNDLKNISLVRSKTVNHLRKELINKAKYLIF
jgi:hypothetical protein